MAQNRDGYDFSSSEKISSETVLNEQIFDCITEWLDTKTTHTATRMPEYYITAMTDNLSDFLEIGSDGMDSTDKTVLRDYMKPFMVDWEGVPDIDSTARACVQHMWNVLNDPSQRFSALDDSLSHIHSLRDNSTMNLLSYMFKVNIRTTYTAISIPRGLQVVLAASFSGIDGRCSPMVLFSYDKLQPKTHMITEEIKGWCTVIGVATDTIQPWWEHYKEFYDFEVGKEALGFYAILRFLHYILHSEDDMFEVACECIQELLSRETTYTGISIPTEAQALMLQQLTALDEREDRLFAEYRRPGPWERECIAHMWNVLNDPTQILSMFDSKLDDDSEYMRDAAIIRMFAQCFHIDIQIGRELYEPFGKKMCSIVMLSCHITTACPLQRSKHQAEAAAAKAAEAAAAETAETAEETAAMRSQIRRMMMMMMMMMMMQIGPTKWMKMMLWMIILSIKLITNCTDCAGWTSGRSKRFGNGRVTSRQDLIKKVVCPHVCCLSFARALPLSLYLSVSLSLSLSLGSKRSAARFHLISQFFDTFEWFLAFKRRTQHLGILLLDFLAAGTNGDDEVPNFGGSDADEAQPHAGQDGRVNGGRCSCYGQNERGGGSRQDDEDDGRV